MSVSTGDTQPTPTGCDFPLHKTSGFIIGVTGVAGVPFDTAFVFPQAAIKPKIRTKYDSVFCTVEPESKNKLAISRPLLFPKFHIVFFKISRWFFSTLVFLKFHICQH